jgi:hypothetical protein
LWRSVPIVLIVLGPIPAGRKLSKVSLCVFVRPSLDEQKNLWTLVLNLIRDGVIEDGTLVGTKTTRDERLNGARVCGTRCALNLLMNNA